MNGKQLRNSILQWAISGRLVPQDSNDEPASELLKRINPKAAPLSPDDAPFPIPDSWCWVRLGSLCVFLSRGKSPKYSEERKYPVFAQKCNLKDGGISLEQARFLDPSTIDKWKDIYKLRNGDVLVNSTGTGTVCRTRMFDEKSLGDYPFVVPDSHVSVVRTYEEINSTFVLYYISSRNTQQYLEDNLAGSTNQKELYIGVLENLLIPLPPLAEQERIVGKVEELLPLVERYNKAQTELDRLNASLKGKLRASLLQEAIAGRLVPQDPTDEPASALLHRINPKFTPQPTDEPLPTGWTACTLEDIVEIKDNLRTPINSAERNKRIAGKKDSELYPYYGATGQVGYIDNYLMDGKYLLLGEDGAPFLDKMATKAYIVEGKCWVNNHAHVLLPHCNTEYMCLYLNQFAYYSYVTGSTRLKLTQASMKKMPVLVPPLAEQERIVGKVEELFAVLDALPQ